MVVDTNEVYPKKGMYTNADYDEYRHFMEQVGRNDNAIILTKIETR
jgi:hypothetical protein